MEAKAWRFLEIHDECGSKIRRTANRLRETQEGCTIHHITVKSILEFLKDTEVYMRYQSMVAEQVQDFYSGAVLVSLYDQYQAELSRAKDIITRYVGKNKEEREKASRSDHEMALKWSRYEKSILDKIANISLVVRGAFTKGDSKEDPKDKDYDRKYKDILEEATEFDEEHGATFDA